MTDTVYALTNPAMPGLVKLGWTSRSEVASRMRELASSGVPLPFELVAAVEVEDGQKVERALHAAFAPQRVNPRREFFEIEPEQIESLLPLLGRPSPELDDEARNAVAGEPEEERAAARRRRPSIDFLEVGLNVGDELVHADGAVCRVASARRVLYEGEEMSLSALCQRIGHRGGGISRGWSCGGRGLDELYLATYGPRMSVREE